MGLIGKVIGTPGLAGGLAGAAKDVAEVFTPNATRKMELSHDGYAAVLAASTAEFSQPRAGWFDSFVNGLNRLPRPFLALSTIALFGYSMADPSGFSVRMQGLGFVPEPLWWLLGAIVSFYFGAREAYYFRGRGSLPTPPATGTRPRKPAAKNSVPVAVAPPAKSTEANAALDDWRAGRG